VTARGPGFDGFVGNPPFAGKNTLQESAPIGYADWLKVAHEESHGNADLVAHFFRRSFHLLRDGGAMGLIATNTVAQGDTRSTGLRWISQHGGEIYEARRRYKWPGVAAVIVSVVHIRKARKDVGAPAIVKRLDGRAVERISAFLFHQGGDDDPVPLKWNEGKAFVGSYVLGMGFTFDDTNPKATSLAEMNQLLASDPRNGERIFPYLGGEELNTSPTHAHHRYVINFAQMSEEEARRWPQLMAIVESKVKPERLKQKREARARYWWRFGEATPALFAMLGRFRRVLGIARVSDAAAFSFIRSDAVFSDQIVAIAFDEAAALSLLQSRTHETWARFFGSSMKDDLRYTPSDCFETFPFPRAWERNARLTDAGGNYDAHRAALMVRNSQGLTQTYNRFHDPDERDPGILELRRLHDEMDRAVLDAYGWQDLEPTCEFLLDHDDEVGEGARTTKAVRSKPWRYRWPDTVRDDVLARLLALNAELARGERLRGDEAALPRVQRAPGSTTDPARKAAAKRGTKRSGPAR
jgi:hypothetical protein